MRRSEEWLAEYKRNRAVSTPLPTQATKPRKYRNIPCRSADGKRFDSKLERDFYEQLVLQWKAGDVRWFVRQVTFELEGGVRYRCDFLVVPLIGDIEVIDTTGVMTPMKANKLKQMQARYGINVRVVSRSAAI